MEIVSVFVLSKVLSLDWINLTNLEYRARERQSKRESRWQATEAQREKKTKETFFVGRNE